MKHFMTMAILLFGLYIHAQVGINNNSPQATLDITAKTTDGSKPEGLLAPRLTGDQIKSADLQYNAAQKGLIVYATSAVTLPSTKTANINSEGYYYFDGSIWQRMDINTNIYNSNGDIAPSALTNRNVAFTNGGSLNIDSNTLYVDATNNRVGIGTATPSVKFELNNGAVNGAVKIVDGTQGEGKVLTSDANGTATWQTPSGGSWTAVWYNFSAAANGNLSGGSTKIFGIGGSASSNSIRVPYSGLYKITGATYGTYVSSVGECNFFLLINGSNSGFIFDNNVPASDGAMYISTVQYRILNANDIISTARQALNTSIVNTGSIEVSYLGAP
jgi:hypothetical protein